MRLWRSEGLVNLSVESSDAVQVTAADQGYHRVIETGRVILVFTPEAFEAFRALLDT